jgi:acetyl/propionyl-CoA carboxylase alpha subunit
MAKVTLQPRGAEAPLTLDVGWEAAAGGESRFSVRIQEESLSGEVRFGPGGEGSLRLGARVLPFFVARSGSELHLWLDGESYLFTLPAASGAGRQRAQALAASGEVVAPMPGIVLKVLAQPGDTVAAQAPLVVLESMKMELTVPAPAAGRVVEVLCDPGQRIDRGAVLLRLELQEP